MFVRGNRAKKLIPYAAIVLLCAGIFILALAANQTKAMAGRQDESKERMHKGMKHNEMMEQEEMMGMCPLHMMMCQRMMEKEIIDTQDGGVIVMACDKLYKYDKDLNLVKEVELKATADVKQKMEQMHKECVENCQGMMKMREKGKSGSM